MRAQPEESKRQSKKESELERLRARQLTRPRGDATIARNANSFRWGRVARGLRLVVAATLLAMTTGGGCAVGPRFRGPATLASVGIATALGGSALWVVGERSSGSNNALPVLGLATAAVGMLGVIAAGGWIAAEAACRSDPDCDESEECREIPAPPGGVPYKQCMPR